MEATATQGIAFMPLGDCLPLKLNNITHDFLYLESTVIFWQWHSMPQAMSVTDKRRLFYSDHRSILLATCD